MEDYPRTLEEFEGRFVTEQACREYLMQLRWPRGFACPRCGGQRARPEDVQNSVETRGSPELVVYAAWAWAGGGGDSLRSWSSNFGKCR